MGEVITRIDMLGSMMPRQIVVFGIRYLVLLFG